MSDWLLLDMISQDARHTMQISQTEDGGRQIDVFGPDIIWGHFTLNVSAEVAHQIGLALLRREE